MNAFKLLILGCIAAVAYVLVSAELRAQAAQSNVECVVSNGIARIVLRDMANVREVKVLRPEGGVVYLYSHQLAVYSLAAPKEGVIEVDPWSQLGSQYAEDGKLHTRKAFSDTGNYNLIVLGEAAKATAQVKFLNIGCSLDLIEDKGFQQAEVLSPNSISQNSFLPRLDCPEEERLGVQSSCRPSLSCENAGRGYCCTAVRPGDPCFCDNCCVALAAEFEPSP